jgi:hypothetical protein
MAITANSNWRGGMFYFPTTFLETVCLLAFIASAFPFFLTIVIGVGFIIPLLHSIGLGHQQLIVPTTGTPMTLTLDFVLVTCLAGSVQVVAWMIAIERIRSKRTSRNQSHFSG